MDVATDTGAKTSPRKTAGSSASSAASKERSRDGGGRGSAPAVPGRWWRLSERAKRSAWTPVVAKAATVFAGMIALAGVGAASTLQGVGIPMATEPSQQEARASLGGVWIPEAPADSASPPPSPKIEPAAPQPDPEPSSAPSSAPPDSHDRPAPGVTEDGKVILNTASVEDFDRLPGIGKSRAEAIVALRRRLGRFRKATDLLRVRGIGVRSLKKLLPLIVVDPPERE